MMRPASLVAVLLLSGLAACASTNPRGSTGEGLLAKGAFGDAEAWYRGLLEKAPGDLQAADGLLKARKGWVGKSLGTVRARRQGGDPEGAAGDFAKVVRQARDWGLGAGAVGTGYDEEASASAEYLDARLRWFVQNRRLLAGRTFLEQWRDAYGDSPAGRQRYADRIAELNDLGAKHCEMLWTVASARSPWFADFAARYCGGWDVMKVIPKALSDARNGERFGRVDAKVAVSGLAPAEADALSRAVAEALQATPGFSGDAAGTMEVGVRGAMVATDTRTPEPLEHPYALQIPYTTLEEYCEWQSVPVTSSRWVEGNQVTVTEQRRECISRTREIQKVRVEPRVLRFEGRRVRQSFRVQMQAQAGFQGRSYRGQVSDSLDEIDFAHDQVREDIGLKADPLVLTSRTEWLQARFTRLAKDLADRYLEGWSARWCVPVEGGLDVQAEQALRCMDAHPDDPPDFVVAWSKDNFGMDVKELRKAVP